MNITFAAHRLQYINSYLFYMGFKEDSVLQFTQHVLSTYEKDSRTLVYTISYLYYKLPTAKECFMDRTSYYTNSYMYMYSIDNFVSVHGTCAFMLYFPHTHCRV